MDIDIELQTDSDGSSSLNLAPKYTISKRCNCIIVHGSISLDKMGSLVASIDSGPKKHFFSPHNARLARATLVIGTAEDLETLENELAPESIAMTRLEYAQWENLMTEEEIDWLAIGNVGASSSAIYTKITGIPVIGFEFSTQAHPHDIHDFIRCQKLLEAIPKIKTDFDHMAEVSPMWEKLVKNWEDIVIALDSKNPEWRSGKIVDRDASELLAGVIRGNAPTP